MPRRTRPKTRPSPPPAPPPPRRPLRRRYWLIPIVTVVSVGLSFALWDGLLGAGASLNVLVITVDTTRADYLGCYGSATAQTPNLDRLAREGALFERCSTSTVMTLPSHCTIMTGLYPFVHGVRRNGVDQLPGSATTLAEVFKSAGYVTEATVASYVLDPRFGLAQGFDAYHAAPTPRGGNDVTEIERKGEKICDDALEFLRERGQERFFLWAHFYDPHYPYESPRHPDIFSAEAYADEITYMDRQIGRLLDGLRELGLEHNTLVVLVGDHGEGLNDHHEYQHGFFVYNTCEHVPLLVRCPTVVPAGRRVEAVVRTADVAPTILDLAGLPALNPCSGVSLTPLLTGRATDLQLTAYAESPETYALLGLSTIRALTVGQWKYIFTTSPQLFDLAADPNELHNVVAEHTELAAQLQEQLHDLLATAPPRLADGASTSLGSSDLARLESLGYVGVVAGGHAGASAGLDVFEPQGGDPHAFTEVILLYEHARNEIGAGQLAAAEKELRDVLSSLPGAPAPLRDLAFVQTRQGRRAEAAQTYEQALAIMPLDTRTRVQYATLLMEGQQWPQAIAQAEQALRVTPNDFSAHALLGEAYTQLERYEPACKHLQAAVRIEPQVARVQLALGHAYFQLGHFTEAADCFQKVLALEPRSEQAQAGLRAIAQQLRR